MRSKPDWLELESFIQSKQRLLITTHVHPDGDAIGSEIAMAEYARQCGCEVVILNSDPTPQFFQLADGRQEIQCFDPRLHEKVIQSMDGCVIVDISDWPRLQAIGKLLRRYRTPIACVDHHIPTDQLGAVQINLEYASSAGEVLYRFFKYRKVPLTRAMVNALYLCVLTDTGAFRFSNVTPFALRMAADLLHQGAEFSRIYEQVYENESRSRTLLKGLMLAQMKFACADRYAYCVVTQAQLKETGAELWETEGFSELPRHIQGIEISALFTELADRQVKMSFRSKGHVPINGLAIQFGGGGHLYAAGANLAMPLAEAIERVNQAAAALLRQYEEV
jgi:bifunctional oligoribonuclease and PAP phosphatase NrnA